MEVDISIITPAYNPGKLILDTYQSLEEQTFKNFEWIIVNDKSDEINKQLINKIKKDASFEVVIINNIINMKQAKSKNIGLKHAKGQYIKFLDADDLLDEKHLENQLNLLLKQKTKHYAVFSPTVNFVNTISNSTKNSTYRSVKKNNISQLKRFLVYPFFHHCSCLFNKEDLININGFNDNLITDEDGDLIIRLMLDSIVFLPEENSFYFYRKHDFNTRVSNNDSDEKWLARLDVCLSIESKLIGKYSEAKESLAQRLDVIGLLAINYSQDTANIFFQNAKRVYPNYSKPGNLASKLIRVLFGNNGYYKFKKLIGKV